MGSQVGHTPTSAQVSKASCINIELSGQNFTVIVRTLDQT